MKGDAMHESLASHGSGGERAGYRLQQDSGLWLVRGGQASLDALVNFFAVNGNVFRSVDADSDLLAANAQDGDRNVITNVYAFTDFAGEYQHGLLLDCFVGHLIRTVQRSVFYID